jgi:hypothetical protein
LEARGLNLRGLSFSAFGGRGRCGVTNTNCRVVTNARVFASSRFSKGQDFDQLIRASRRSQFPTFANQKWLCVFEVVLHVCHLIRLEHVSIVSNSEQILLGRLFSVIPQMARNW